MTSRPRVFLITSLMLASVMATTALSAEELRTAYFDRQSAGKWLFLLASHCSVGDHPAAAYECATARIACESQLVYFDVFNVPSADLDRWRQRGSSLRLSGIPSELKESHARENPETGSWIVRFEVPGGWGWLDHLSKVDDVLIGYESRTLDFRQSSDSRAAIAEFAKACRAGTTSSP